jgi:GTP pyrophosphokinase
MEKLKFYRYLIENLGKIFSQKEKKQLKKDISDALNNGILLPQAVEETLNIAILAQKELSLGTTAINAILLYDLYKNSILDEKYIKKYYNNFVFDILDGLVKSYRLYEKNMSIEDENFRKFLISLSSDARVIMIMLVERLYTIRNLDNFEVEKQQKVAREVSFLFAPLAHRMGLYAIKTEMEDLSLKYIAPDIYKDISQKLRDTKKERENYITEFILPVKKRLLEQGLKFEIKGRTKSINSIYNKIRKQGVPFEKVYDLFAIRIIIARRRNAKKPTAGTPILWLPICTRQTQTACAIGFPCRNSTATNRCISPLWDRRGNGLRCKFVQAEWTKSPKKVLPRIGNTRA